MTTIKSYTDIEQSKKLAEILPLESADMYWWSTSKRSYIEAMDDGDFNEAEGHIRAWSLAALLNILPTIDDRNAEFCKDIRCDKWHVYYHGTATLPIIDTDRYENVIDACYKMVIKLHELNLL